MKIRKYRQIYIQDFLVKCNNWTFLGPDLNKSTLKDVFETTGKKLNMDWVWDKTKALLLILIDYGNGITVT